MKKDEQVKLKWWVIPGAIIIGLLIIGGIVLGVSKLTGNKKEFVDMDAMHEKTTQESEKNNDNSKREPINTSNNNKDTSESTPSTENTEKIRGCVNTFAGYTSLFAANGGNTTQENSNFDKAGLNVEIYIEDDDDNIIEAFKNGEIQFFAMTINKMALVAKQLEDEGIETVMPFFLDTSTGGDGIITDSSVKNIADLKNVKIGMAKNSVSTAIPVWYLNIAGLGESEVQEIVDNFVLFDSTKEAVDAFVAGEVGAVSTWNITGALEKAGSHVLTDTNSAEFLVIDGIVFNKGFAESHKDEILTMIDAILVTVNDINDGVNVENYYEAIRKSVPDFASYSNDELASELSYAKFLGYNGNLQALEVAGDLYKDFSKVWTQLGYETNENYQLIDDSYITDLSWWEGEEESTEKSFTDNADKYVDQEALIKKYATITFNGDVASFKTGEEEINKQRIDEFVKVAKILNKTIIRISGHVNLGEGSSVWDEEKQSYKLAPGFKSSEFAYKLSEMRAETVKEYMVSQGIDESRIIIEGLGGDFPIDTNDTDTGKANNRSCEISFYQAGGY